MMNKKIKNDTSSLIVKVKLFAISAIFFGLLAVGANAQTVLVNYAFNDAVAATPCNGGTSNATGGVTSTFTTSTGVCTTPAGAATTASAYTQNATAGFAVSVTGFAAGNSQYFQFQLSGVSVFQNYQIYFQALRSGTGPANGDLQYSTDGITFTTFQSAAIPTGTPVAVNLDLSSITAINNQPNVYFRIVGTNGTGGGGTFRIDNFQVQALRPTAATASISGRVLTAQGRGIANATLMISGNSLGESKTVRTNPFGYYKFNDLESAETYVISVMSKQYIFDNPSRVISLSEDFTAADFTAR